MIKSFDEKEHEKYDELCKNMVIKVLCSFGVKDLRKNNNKYGVDVLGYNFNADVEGKDIRYFEKIYQEDIVHFLFRKEKYSDNDFHYILLSTKEINNTVFFCGDIIIASNKAFEAISPETTHCWNNPREDVYKVPYTSKYLRHFKFDKNIKIIDSVGISKREEIVNNNKRQKELKEQEYRSWIS